MRLRRVPRDEEPLPDVGEAEVGGEELQHAELGAAERRQADVRARPGGELGLDHRDLSPGLYGIGLGAEEPLGLVEEGAHVVPVTTQQGRVGQGQARLHVCRPLLVGASACSQQAKAERDGRDLAQAVCDLRDAGDADASEAARSEIDEQLDDLVQRYGVATADDRADIANNLADLAEHAVQGNEVLAQQDLTVLARSAKNIRDDVGEVQSSAWNGFNDGLQECLS